MVKWLMRKGVAAFERQWDYDASYLHEMIEADPRAAWMFQRATSLGKYRKDVPVDALAAAALTAVRHEDCGPCTQLGVSMFERAGVDPKVLTAVLTEAPTMMPPDFAAGHTLGGGQTWSPAGETDVLRAMRTFRFDAEGVSRTYLEFYLGFGFILSVDLLLQAVVLWQMAAMTRAGADGVRSLIVSFLLAQVASGVLASRFIFAVPVVFSGLIAACLTAALYLSRPSRGATRPG